MVLKGCTIWLILAVVVGMAVDGRADLTMPGSVAPSAVSSASSAGETFSFSSAPMDHRVFTVGMTDDGGLESPLTPSCPLSQNEVSSEAQKVKQIPPPPGSATLFLYTVSGLGAYRLGRSAKKLNFGNLPEWYQGSGPRQIGHAFAVEVDLTLLVLPMLAAFDPPMPDRSLICSFREDRPRLRPQYFLSERDVRGPPFSVWFPI